MVDTGKVVILSKILGRCLCVLAAVWLHGFSAAVRSDVPMIKLEIRNHLFYPAEVIVPAHTKVKLLVINRDATPEEFESYELNREKVIPGNTKAIIFIGPLEVGEYPFFGEFNMSTALGKVIAR